MERRDFIKTAAVTGIAGAMNIAGGSDVSAKPSSAPSKVDLVAVRNGTPAQMFEKAIAEMGGMKQYIKPGYKVVLKPNIGWDRTEEWAANTNPELVAAVVKSCLAAGAKEVLVFDHTCDEWKFTYKNSGIEDAVKQAGGKMAFAHEEKYYREMALPGGKSLKNAKIHEAILDCDAWINMPVLKNHDGAKMTIAMKNLMGIVWDRQIFHRNDLQQCIADCFTYAKKPVLNIVDAYRVMKSNGPKGRSKSDAVDVKRLFMSTDIVAVDTAAATLLVEVLKKTGTDKAISLNLVGHLAKGQELNLGTMDLDKLNIKRIEL